MSAREEILARIRSAVGTDRPAVTAVPRDYRQTSGYPPHSALDLLADRLVDYRAGVHRCTRPELPRVLADVLERHGMRRVVIPAGLDRGLFPSTVEVVVDDGALAPAELDALDGAVTGCAAAVAESGTLILDAGPDQGRRALTLVPDRHVCLVDAATVVGGLPEAWSRLDPRRPLTLISGPSATSDIELSRVEGVHGPRTLVVILITGPAGQ